MKHMTNTICMNSLNVKQLCFADPLVDSTLKIYIQLVSWSPCVQWTLKQAFTNEKKKENIVMVHYLIFHKNLSCCQSNQSPADMSAKYPQIITRANKYVSMLIWILVLFPHTYTIFSLLTGRTRSHYGRVIRWDLLLLLLSLWWHFRNTVIFNGHRVLAIKVLRPIDFITVTCKSPKYYMHAKTHPERGINKRQTDPYLDQMCLVWWVILTYVPYIHWWKAGFVSVGLLRVNTAWNNEKTSKPQSAGTPSTYTGNSF